VNLIEAIKSGCRFRRLGFAPPDRWWPRDKASDPCWDWVDQSDVADWFRTISLEDLLANDWEVEQKGSGF
jgi:hypothetical protein